MLFRRKGKLRRTYDLELIEQMNTFKQNWINQKSLLDKSFDPSDEAITTAKIAELKYFYLFKEAKKRNVKLHK